MTRTSKPQTTNRKPGTHSPEALSRALAVQRQALAQAERTWATGNRCAMQHIGECNRKTGCHTEATLAVLTCAGCAIEGDHACAYTCYALWREDRIYTTCRRNHAENTVVRRMDSYAYYTRIFSAVAQDKPNAYNMHVLRLNESGDFETANQLRAAIAAAKCYPSVQALAYTRRYELLSIIKSELPPNLRVVVSAFTCPAAAAMLERAGVPISRVVDRGAGDCPAQRVAAIAKATGKTCAWTCAMCAKLKIGCWGADKTDFGAH